MGTSAAKPTTDSSPHFRPCDVMSLGTATGSVSTALPPSMKA